MATCKVKVCRICFATDCQLHLLHEDMKLYKAYEAVTALVLADEEDLPPYLCTSCADQLMSCARFRHRSLQAHLMLLDIVKNHDHISVESIQDVVKTSHCDSDNKLEDEIMFSNIKIEIKHEVIPEDHIASDVSDNIKTEYLPKDDAVHDLDVEAGVAPCVETNGIVKEEVVLEVPVNNNVDDGKLGTVCKREELVRKKTRPWPSQKRPTKRYRIKGKFAKKISKENVLPPSSVD